MLGFFERKPVFDPSVLQFLELNDELESNIPGLYVIGDLTGMPLIKTALNQGADIIDTIAPKLRGAKPEGENAHDLVIVGAGVAGLSAAMEAQRRGIDYVVLEQGKVANTIANFPKGKRMLCEPQSLEVRSPFWAPPESTKEELVERWRQQVAEAKLNIRTGVSVTGIRRDGHFEIESGEGVFRGNIVLLAIGKQGNPRKLKVPGEDLDKVANKLYDPKKYHGSKILVVGGGDAAAETVLALCAENEVTQAMIEPGFVRPKAKNKTDLERAVAEGKLTAHFETTVKEITPDSVTLNTPAGEVTIENDYVFTMIGAEPPFAFLKRIGVRMADEWSAARAASLAAFFAVVALFYYLKSPWAKDAHMSHLGWPALLTLAGVFALGWALRPAMARANGEWWRKLAKNDFWVGAGFTALFIVSASVVHFVGLSRGWHVAKGMSWFGVLYTSLVLGFGMEILLRPRDRHLRTRGYIVTRTLLCMFFQTTFLFLLPLVLNWRAYRLTTAWPLARTAIEPVSASNSFYFWWALALAFIGIPIFVYFHGKRYCTMVCGCGALAETFGDGWRDKAPKGLLNRRREGAIYIVLGWAVLVTALLWMRKLGWLGAMPGGGSSFVQALKATYDVAVGLAFAGLAGVGLYPFFGNRIWCRYGCPLAALMNLFGKVKTRLKIAATENCIDCGICNRYCQMGIDIKGFAIQQRSFSLAETPCIGCGECIAVCPMDVLSFGEPKSQAQQPDAQSQPVIRVA